jgi:hypothetical protein
VEDSATIVPSEGCVRWHHLHPGVASSTPPTRIAAAISIQARIIMEILSGCQSILLVRRLVTEGREDEARGGTMAPKGRDQVIIEN